MKLVGTCIIIVCAFLFGRELCASLRKRLALLEQICLFADSVGGYIRCEHMPLDRIVLCRADGDDPPEFIEVCALRLNDGDSFREAWDYAVSESVDMQYLRADEQLHLHRLGGSLGSFDVAGELRLLEQSARYFEERRQSAADELAAKSKLYMSCSVLAGCFAAVLLI